MASPTDAKIDTEMTTPVPYTTLDAELTKLEAIARTKETVDIDFKVSNYRPVSSLNRKALWVDYHLTIDDAKLNGRTNDIVMNAMQRLPCLINAAITIEEFLRIEDIIQRLYFQFFPEELGVVCKKKKKPESELEK